MAATDYGNVAYADESLDVTEAVLKGLNKSYTGIKVLAKVNEKYR